MKPLFKFTAIGAINLFILLLLHTQSFVGVQLRVGTARLKTPGFLQFSWAWPAPPEYLSIGPYSNGRHLVNGVKRLDASAPTLRTVHEFVIRTFLCTFVPFSVAFWVVDTLFQVRAFAIFPTASSKGGNSKPNSVQVSTEGAPATSNMRVFCFSDIHSDMPANMAWVNSLCNESYKQDILICAGDIADSLDVIEATLVAFKKRFREVFFTPGNHELWVMSKDREMGVTDSLMKLDAIMQLCTRLQVHTTPRCITGSDSKAIWIVPMLSWYHKSWDTEPDVEEYNIPGPEYVLRDFRLCKWPAGLDPETDSVALYMDQQNDVALFVNGLDYVDMKASGHPIISFSHFLPHVELIPEKRYLFYPNLAKGAGSNALGARVQRLFPLVHIFGHTHFGWDMTLRGVRYVQAALGYPAERQKRLPSLEVGAFPEEPLLVYDTDAGLPERFGASWSDHYLEHQRNPTNVSLAPWVTGWSRRNR